MSTAVALTTGLALAFVFGTSDAANATAALVEARVARWRVALAFSFVFHVLGALVGGTAVALAVASFVAVPRGDLRVVMWAGSLAAIAFVAAAARAGLPASATYGLVGGVAGAAIAADGVSAVRWGGFHGVRPAGVAGIAAGLVLAPVVGLVAGWLTRRAAVRVAGRATRRAIRPVRASISVAAACVAFSDGSNDGQKAIGVAAVGLGATGSGAGLSIPFWLRLVVAVVLALGTVVAGGRIVRRVGRGYYRPGPLDVLAAQLSSAGVILVAAGTGAPVSTSSVVAAAVVGAGADRHPRHVRWAGVADTVSAWLLTLPVCAVVGAALLLASRAAR